MLGRRTPAIEEPRARFVDARGQDGGWGNVTMPGGRYRGLGFGVRGSRGGTSWRSSIWDCVEGWTSLRLATTKSRDEPALGSSYFGIGTSVPISLRDFIGWSFTLRDCTFGSRCVFVHSFESDIPAPNWIKEDGVTSPSTVDDWSNCSRRRGKRQSDGLARGTRMTLGRLRILIYRL